jgi:hypothetical protein
MRAPFVLTLGTLLCAAWLTACGGNSSDADLPISTALNAEQMLGAGMLPPDGTRAQASTLSSSDMPPDTTATVDSADLPSSS